jgi:arylsulfatase A-like enzyme
MQNAGYKTYIVDNVHNGLYFLFRTDDRKYIDHIVNDYPKYQKYKGYDRDFHTLDEIKEILNNGEKNFLMVIKYGTHFPFQNAFDQSKPIFKNWGTNTNEEKYYLYLNAINTSVDKYWKSLIKTVGNTDTVVLWKSDHSVNITNSSENKAIITHCEAGFTHYKELTSIPGVLYSPNKKYYEGYKNLKNGYSGRHIFSTLLDFAGYNPKDYKRFYGPSFKEPTEEVNLYLVQKSFEMGKDNIFDYINQEKRATISKWNKKRVLKNEIKRKEFIETEEK